MKSKPYTYPVASPEEIMFRRTLIGAILEFGEPHDFESGTMTRPIVEAKNGRKGTVITAPLKPGAALEYYMLQEDGQGFSIFGALRTTYTKSTPVEPVRFAVQFVTVRGTAVIDVAVPSRYAARDSARDRSYDEKRGPHLRVGVLSGVKGVRLEDILLAFAASKAVPAEDFRPLLTVMREQGETKVAAPLKLPHLKLLTTFITVHFGDFSAKVPLEIPPPLNFEEVIPESPAEVPKSDGWIKGVAQAAEETRQADRAEGS